MDNDHQDLIAENVRLFRRIIELERGQARITAAAEVETMDAKGSRLRRGLEEGILKDRAAAAEVEDRKYFVMGAFAAPPAATGNEAHRAAEVGEPAVCPHCGKAFRAMKDK